MNAALPAAPPDGSASLRRPRGLAALDALTAAALLLPGLACPDVMAADADPTLIQASRYQEGARDLGGVPDTRRPVSAQTLLLRTAVDLPRGQGLSLSYTQDSWSGATPITTAPLAAQGNRPIRAGSAGQLVTVGASPMINGSVLLDAQDHVLAPDPGSGRLLPAPALAHTLSSASPETRQQIEARYRRLLDTGALTLGGGVSTERDYRSRFVNVGSRLDLNRKLTTLGLGLSHTRSETAATLDHDATPYITRSAYRAQIESVNGQQVLRGRREDWAGSLALTQVLGPSALFEAQLAHTHSRGYLANPYKVTSVIFAPPAAGAAPRQGDLRALLEQRPDRRRQWSVATKLVLHHAPLDAALHLGWGHARDDWGVRAHRLEAEWFQPLGESLLLAPRLRYYTQSAARFYSPYLVSPQAYRQVSIGPDGQPVVTAFDPARLPAHFSSDQRLSGFGSVALGLGLRWQLAGPISLELGVDHTRQAAALGPGGRDDGRFADFSYWAASAALRLALDAGGSAPAAAGPGEAGHGAHAAALVPAGVTLAHAAHGPGALMVGYRQMQQGQGKPMRRGSSRVDAADSAATACSPGPCTVRPVRMGMRMQMLDLMLGWSDRLTLMLMPQFMSMSMDTRLVDGVAASDVPPHFGAHASAGLGDTQLHALYTLADDGHRRWQLGLGLSLPTGRTDLTHRRSHQRDGQALDLAMQTGSGSWDLLPSLTTLQQQGRWSWGAQLAAVLRLQSHNDDGYALGHGAQAGAWVGYRPTPQLALSLRARHRVDGAVRGSQRALTDGSAAPDFTRNHGGRFTELGVGMTVDLGGLQPGSMLGLELLRPLRSDVNGDQLSPRGGFALQWTQSF